MRFRPGISISALLCVFFVCCISFNAAAAAVCTEGLTDYWKFDETSGTVFANSTGSRGAACVGSCPGPVAGRIGNAVQFNGTGTGLEVPANPSINWGLGQSFSIEFWMKEDSVCNENQVVVGRNDTSIHWWAGCWKGGTAGFVLRDRNGNIAILIGSIPIADGQWHHIVGTRDAGTNTLNLYVDAVKDVSITQNFSTGFESPTAKLDIGWLQLDSGYHFAGSVDELALYKSALSESTVKQHYTDGTTGLHLGYCGCSSTVRIMPLGDSITLGKNDPALAPGGIYEPPSNSITGYRRQLYLSLSGSGYGVDFVGSRKSGSAAMTTPWDVDHQGEVKDGGFTAQDLAASVYNFLSANPADVVLLHIGTNNLNNPPYDTSPAVLSGILDEIYRYNKDITVILALIINADISVESFYRKNISQYNRNVLAMAKDRIARGDRIIVVDQENALLYDEDMYDEWHPKESGYAKMADVWFNALREVLPVCMEFPPVITSSAITDARVGRPYKYDVAAMGTPLVDYRLVDLPSGMSIDTSNGFVQWIPRASGSYTATVQARNSLGTDTQAFVINVADMPSCPAGMSHYWKLDESAGKRYADFIGFDDATCTNCPVPSTGILKGAQRFGAINSVNAADDNTVDWSSKDSFSIEFWMKADKANNCEGNQVMLGRNDNWSELHWWTGCWEGGAAGFVLRDKTGEIAVLKGEKIIMDGQWHLITAVRDSSKNEVSLYVDAVKDASAIQTYSSGFESAGTALNIGWLNLDSGYNYSGSLEEIAIFNKALSDHDIFRDYWDGVNGFGHCEQAIYAPVIVSTPINVATVGSAYEYRVTAAGVPEAVYSIAEGPVGMRIDSLSGMISWTPTGSGIFNVAVRAANGIGKDADQRFSIFVTALSNSSPVIISNPVNAASIGQPYKYSVKASGTPSPVYELVFAPAGMSIDPLTGELDWMPLQAGTFKVVLHATNGIGSAAAQSFSITVQ